MSSGPETPTYKNLVGLHIVYLHRPTICCGAQHTLGVNPHLGSISSDRQYIEDNTFTQVAAARSDNLQLQPGQPVNPNPNTRCGNLEAEENEQLERLLAERTIAFSPPCPQQVPPDNHIHGFDMRTARP